MKILHLLGINTFPLAFHYHFFFVIFLSSFFPSSSSLPSFNALPFSFSFLLPLPLFILFLPLSHVVGTCTTVYVSSFPPLLSSLLPHIHSFPFLSFPFLSFPLLSSSLPHIHSTPPLLHPTPPPSVVGTGGTVSVSPHPGGGADTRGRWRRTAHTSGRTWRW